jgi:hypothetical protein
MEETIIVAAADVAAVEMVDVVEEAVDMVVDEDIIEILVWQQRVVTKEKELQ